jgi:predicted site-specific integrase-resolvase
VQHLRDLHNGRSAELQGLPLCKYRERNETLGHERPKEIPLHDGGLTMIVGYARVSTDGQTLDAQRATLKAAGVERTYAEKISGAKTNRRQLQLAIEALGVGDVLLVTRLDRLARSTRDLLNVLATISEKGAGFKSLADAWADTTTLTVG